jgi:hypothetical protein
MISHAFNGTDDAIDVLSDDESSQRDEVIMKTRQLLEREARVLVDEDVDAMPFRLRLHDEVLYLHTGDAQYDKDHRGYIGASSVSTDGELDSDSIEDVVRSAIDEVVSSYHMTTE